MTNEYWMIEQLEKMAANWDKAANRLNNKTDDMSCGTFSALRDCSASLRNMCEEFKAECGVNTAKITQVSSKPNIPCIVTTGNLNMTFN